LREALGGYQGCWKTLPSHFWVSFFIHGGFTLFGLERMMGYKIGDEDANGRCNWSMKQYLGIELGSLVILDY